MGLRRVEDKVWKKEEREVRGVREVVRRGKEERRWREKGRQGGATEEGARIAEKE